MRKINFNILFLSVLLLLNGCVKETPEGTGTVPVGSDVALHFNVGSRAGDPDPESVVKSVRTVVFGSYASVDRGQLLLNDFQRVTPEQTTTTKVMVKAGIRDIYVIVNEPRETNGNALPEFEANLKTVADMTKLSMNYGGSSILPDGLPMFAKYQNQLLKGTTNTIGDGATNLIDRAVAKVALTLNVDSKNFQPGSIPVIESVVIKNLPQTIYFTPRPNVSTLISSELQTATGKLNGTITTYTNTFYVPEYLIKSSDANAVIEVNGYVSDASRKTKWIIQLGDAMVTGQPYGTIYNITRNRFYNISCNVKSLGDLQELVVQTTIVPWAQGTVIPVDPKVFAIKVKSVINGGHNLVTNPEQLVASGNYTITIDANSSKWYYLIEKLDGTPLYQSGLMAGTTRTVDIARWAGNEEFVRLSIYQPDLAPAPSGVVGLFTPRVKNTWSKATGFISKAELGDWGAALPSYVAGVQVFPNESPDPMKSLCAQTGIGITVQNKGLGMGEANSAAIIQYGIESRKSFEAVNYCKEKGAFLPSYNELLFLYQNRGTLGVGYQFDNEYYWCSNFYFNGGDALNMGNGLEGGSTVTKKYKVRCIRYIK